MIIEEDQIRNLGSTCLEARGFGGFSSYTMLPRDTATDAIRRWPSAGGCPAANILLSAGGDLAILFT